MRPVLDGHDVCLDPPATAQVWLGTGVGFSEIAVPGVRLARGDALVAVELAVAGPHEVAVASGRTDARVPVVLGGSAVGRVVEADEHARSHDGRRLRPGMRVVWSRTVSCGRCVVCRRGLATTCPSVERYGRERTRRSWQLSGAFASHVHLRRGTAVVVVADDVPAAVLAPVAWATATAAEMLHRASSVLALSGVPSLEGQVVVVSGAGVVGLVTTAMATDAGARVVVVESQEARRQRSRAFGAVAVADPAASPGPHALPQALASVDRSGRRRTVGLAVDGAAGASALVEQVAVGGVVVLAAGARVAGGEVGASIDRIVDGAVTVTGVREAGPGRLASAAAWASEAWRRWPLESFVGRTVPLAGVGEALAAEGGDDGLIGIGPSAR
jgi:threonine dehydrogenase-like Zn-dependent dehydrogenase